ncbi:CBM35 domain-containing protein [Streptomyces sp. NPDC051018]|uniref:CBM35 domain-containing protein n=1 Tax=Streptomyces sp. NPDC051018 TaxID=3365639 RepID=UPI00379BA997
MTAANNGGNTPEDDDPFGYLYEDGQAAGATPPGQSRGYGYPGPAAQPGVPRTSYNQVRTVGERQYGGQSHGQGHGQGHGQAHGQVPQQQGYGPQEAYGQPNAQYAAPETYPGGAPARPAHPNPGTGRGGRGPNTKGLLLGAIAVVAVVVIGITAALMTSGGDKDKADGNPRTGGGPSAAESVKPSEQAPKTEKPAEAALPKQDAATLQLGAPAQLGTDIEGAEGTGGAFVTGFNAVGASVTWKASVAEAGEYRLYVRYAIPAKDANATLTINGKANSNPIRLRNFIDSSDPELEKNWQTTWAPVNLKQGTNEIKISCEQGNQCDAILDWLQVSDGEL